MAQRNLTKEEIWQKKIYRQLKRKRKCLTGFGGLKKNEQYFDY